MFWLGLLVLGLFLEKEHIKAVPIAEAITIPQSRDFEVIGVHTLEASNSVVLSPNPIPDSILNHYIDLLATCESGQIPDRVHLNDGKKGSHSYGWIQFKIDTFNEMGEKYRLPHDDIMSPAQQIPIAKEMLKDGLWRHWRICGEKIGLDKLL